MPCTFQKDAALNNFLSMLDAQSSEFAGYRYLDAQEACQVSLRLKNRDGVQPHMVRGSSVLGPIFVPA